MTVVRPRRLLVMAAAALLAAAAGAVLHATAAAADTITFRSVDATAFPTVSAKVVVTGRAPATSAFAVQEDGLYVPTSSVTADGRSARPAVVVVVVDTTQSMAQSDRIGQAREAVRSIVAAKRPGDRVAVVGFGSTARVLAEPTADGAAVEAAVELLVPAGDSPLYDAVRLGAGLLAGVGEADRALLVVTDGRDIRSSGTFDEARSTVLQAKAPLFALALPGSADFEPSSLKLLASASGGGYEEVRDPTRLPAAATAVIANLANEYTVTYTSGATRPFQVTVAAGGLEASSGTVAPAALAAAAATLREESPPRSLGPLHGSLGPLIVGLLVSLALGLAGYAVLELVVPQKDTLGAALGGYTLHPTATGRDDDGEEGSIIRAPILLRAVSFTERVARRRGVLAGFERRLEQADLKLRAGEVALLTLVAAVLVAVAASVLWNGLVAIVLAVVVLVSPTVVLNTMASVRRRRFTSQLPDMLNLLSAVLRSGYAVVQGLDAVSKEVPDPMGTELRRVLAEAQLGRDVTEALVDCAERMQSADFEWAVMAIGIQREVGGNLAELLSTVADTMVQRERLRREVKGLTAEGRMSAYVLGLLTPGIALVMYSLNPEYVQILFDRFLGQVLLGGGIVLALFGFWWMNKIIQVDI